MVFDKDFLRGIKIAIYAFLTFISLSMIFALSLHNTNEILSGNFNGDFIFNGNFNFSNANVSNFEVSSNILPAGIIMTFSSDKNLGGWLECDGSEVSRTTYSKLFSVIGTTYGSGDGSSTFNLPDLRGEFIRGFDNGRGIDGGRVLGSFQDHQFETHRHSSSTNANNLQTVYTGGNLNQVGRQYPLPMTFTVGNPNSGNHGAETRPRNLAMKYYIKY